MRTGITAKVLNALGLQINPATSEKQDEIINAIEASDGGSQYATRVDEASATVSYIGQAVTGSSTATAVWRIKKMDTTSGIVITWADGNPNFDNIWDNRASLTYS